MKLEHIKKLPDGKYKLIFDDNDKIITYDDVIIKNHLLYNKELDSETINKINADTVYYDVYNKTIKYIMMRMRSKKEILLYLEKFNLKDIEIDKIFTNLERLGLVDDRLYAFSYASDRLNLSNDGPNKIYNDLVSHNIDEVYIKEAIDSLDKEEITLKLERLITKRIKLNHKQSNYMLKQKTIMELVQAGFDKDTIIEVFDSQELEKNDILNDTYQKLYDKLSRKYDGNELYRQIKNKLYQKGFDINEINAIMSSE